MQGPPPISEARAILMQSGESPSEIEAALRVSAAAFALGTLYSDLLNRMVFKHPRPGYDAKDIIKFKRLLRDDEAYYILLLLWRESPFVTDECLERMSLAREFTDAPLTAWGLATKLATIPDELAKTNSRIRAVGLAAEAFGLIERENLRTTSKPLIGTQFLHQFMMALSTHQYQILAPLLSLMNAGSGARQQ
jgi:hypothetical protein